MITDTELSAYLDGELDARRALEIDDAAAADPQLKARIAALRGRDTAVSEAFAALLERPVPDALTAAVRAAAARAEAAPAAENVVSLAQHRRPTPSGVRAWAWPSSIAATLMVGVLVGRLVLPAAAPGDWVSVSGSDAPAAAPKLAQALSAVPSGKSFDLPGGRTGRVTLTFASQTGALCRAFEIDSAAARRSGLACRSGGSGWALVALAPAQAAGGAYQTASGPGDDPVSAMVDHMIQGEPMDAAQESAALKGTPAKSASAQK